MEAPDAKKPLAVPLPVPRASTPAPWNPGPVVRVLTLAWTSIVCGFVAALAALFVMGLLSWDQTHGSPLQALPILFNPFTILGLLYIAAPASLVGFLASLPLLWRTDLARSIPVVAGATILTATLSAPLGLFAMLPPLIVGVIAMGFCRVAYPLPQPGRPPEPLFHL